MISNILNKESIHEDSAINILYEKNSNNEFNNFIKDLFPNISLIDLTKTFYGINNPNIAICPNDSNNLTKIVELCKFFHIPLILVYNNADNYIKPEVIIDFKPFYKIALTKTKNKMLTNKYDKTISFDMYSQRSKTIWRNLILELSQEPFIIKDGI